MPIIILLIGALMATINESLTLGAGSHSQLIAAYIIGGVTIGGSALSLKLRRLE